MSPTGQTKSIATHILHTMIFSEVIHKLSINYEDNLSINCEETKFIFVNPPLPEFLLFKQPPVMMDSSVRLTISACQ